MYSRWKSNWIQSQEAELFYQMKTGKNSANSHLLCQVTRNQEPNTVITALKITSTRAINKIEWRPTIELPLMLFPDTVLLSRQFKNYNDNQKESIPTLPSFQVGAHLDSGCLEGLPTAWLSPAPQLSPKDSSLSHPAGKGGLPNSWEPHILHYGKPRQPSKW